MTGRRRKTDTPRPVGAAGSDKRGAVPARGQGQDDDPLWAAVKKSVTPLRHDQHVPDQPPPRGPSPAIRRLDKDPVAALWREASGSAAGPAVSQGVRAEGHGQLPARIERRTQRRIAKGVMAVDTTLDLHGMSQRQAHALLIRTVLRMVESGRRTLLVVTGKGGTRFSQTASGSAAFRRRADFGPEGGGVLKRMVPLWLSEPPLAAHISGIVEAAAHHGGAGALYVRVKRERERS